MAEWRVYINGQNFWLEWEGEPRKLGFYTTRFVEAGNEEEAELAAVQLIRDDSKLKGVLNEKRDPPLIHVENIEESHDRDPEYPNTGFVFYEEKEGE